MRSTRRHLPVALLVALLLGLIVGQVTASPPHVNQIKLTNNTSRVLMFTLGTGQPVAHGAYYTPDNPSRINPGTSFTHEYYGSFFFDMYHNGDSYDVCTTSHAAGTFKVVDPSNNIFWCEVTLNKNGPDVEIIVNKSH